jgi:2',3'-cyclic-nucleotide 2'-phosphodiesterase (5'-nucleotidase family)
VQTGQYGHYVGRLELAIDLDTEKVVDYKGELVEMSKGQTPLDEEMIAWAAAKESEICPEASRVLGRAAQPIEGDRLARLYAEAIREKAGAEVGLEVPSRLRSGIEAGVIDYNAVFKTYAAERSRNVVVASFGGRLILDCLENVRTNRGSIQWSGFTAEVDYDKPVGQRVVHSSLDPERTYDVALSAGCLMDLGRLKIIPPKTQSRAAGFTVVDALADAIAARGEIE